MKKPKDTQKEIREVGHGRGEDGRKDSEENWGGGGPWEVKSIVVVDCNASSAVVVVRSSIGLENQVTLIIILEISNEME